MARIDECGTDVRLLDQYRRSPRLIALLGAVIDRPAKDIRVAVESLYGRLDIDRSKGVQLDRIGEIVGRSRPSRYDDLLVDFGDETFAFKEGEFDSPDRAFSSLDDDTVGGRLAALSQGRPMPDRDYRLLLKATIHRNTSGSTIPEIERYTALVLGQAASVLVGFTVIDVQFPRPLRPQERRIIERTMRPAAGIRIRDRSFSRGPDGFGFSGRAGNTGFGSIGAQHVGDGFARLF